MNARSTAEASLPLAWPLAGSVVLTTAVVAFVCTPPGRDLHSWTQIFSRATVYLLVAGCVHALAVWGVCRVRDESEDAGGALIWGVIWAAWIAVVWLPLVALLTAEHSPWVAMVLPLTAVFATMLLKWQGMQAQAVEMPEGVELGETERVPFHLLESPPMWRVLLPAVGTSVAAQIGVGLMAGGHAWTAGCLFGAGAIYPVGRWMERVGAGEAGGPGSNHRGWGRTAAGNSAIVWLLLVMALVPFIAMYAAGALSSLLGVHPQRVSLAAPRIAHGKSSGYSGIILVQPKKPHEIVVSDPTAAAGSVMDTRVIPFDGAYWYFKQPATRPEPSAQVMQGDPVKRHVFSTDMQPLMMEAHQPLGRSVAMNCCRSLRVDVTNADNVPGTIAVEVLLRDTSKKTAAVSLGTIVLPSSTVSPMPLKRPPVEDKVTFLLPQGARGRSFDEITVRLKPELSRSLAGTQVAVKDFVLQR